MFFHMNGECMRLSWRVDTRISLKFTFISYPKVKRVLQGNLRIKGQVKLPCLTPNLKCPTACVFQVILGNISILVCSFS